MRKIAIVNNKGGVGKTSSAFNIGAYFSKKGFKVLMIDLDSQGNLTGTYGIKDNQIENTIYEMIKGQKLTPIKISETMDLIPATLETELANIEFVNRPSWSLLLKRFLVNYEDKYDICIIDSSPSLNILTKNAFGAADSIYIPMRPGIYEYRGADLLVRSINEIKLDNPGLEIKGIFLTLYENRTNLSKDIEMHMQSKFGSILMETKIRKSLSVEECPATRTSVFESGTKSAGARDYEKLALEILQREGL